MSNNQKIVIGVMGITFRQKNNKLEFLLSQRHQPDRPLWHHKWQLIGGGMEFGETPEQTLAREFQEEAKVSVSIKYPYPIVKTSTWYAKTAKSSTNSHVCLITYIVSTDDQTPDWGNDDETEKMDWLTIDQIAQLDTLPNVKECILEAQKIIEKEKLI